MLVYSVRVRGKRQFRNDFDRIVTDIAPRVVGEQFLDTIQGPFSPWPVKTGLSKASFYIDIDGNTVLLQNLTDYAHIVEERQGKARQTWDEFVDRQELKERIIEEARK